MVNLMSVFLVTTALPPYLWTQVFERMEQSHNHIFEDTEEELELSALTKPFSRARQIVCPENYWKKHSARK